ncbi:hypothetical protein [Streptomyces sp. V4I2]|uniref:hypothetical protein n=1 Tax=Streptomyces sp. V4I2 TaxID=3042280 RepID=UPI00277FE40E|nr:hypothetical protein [Streptomyces sp. V4I2]MDQ1044383.1 hypothetical protein [Streptomyces sp. V4I2]
MVDGRAPRTHRVDEDRDFDDIALSEDERSYVAWGESGWELRSTVEFEHLNGASAPIESNMSSPDRAVSIESVRRFGKRGFLLLDGKGLARLDGATGEADLLEEVDCAWTPETNDHACVTALGRPDEPGQFLILRADGHAELWELKPDGALERIDETDFHSLIDDVYEGGEVAFRSDGRSVAVATRAGVFVWRPGEKEPVLLAGNAGGVGPYDGKGRFILFMEDGGDQLWDEDGADEPVTLYAADYVEKWTVDGRQLHGDTALGPVTYDVGLLTDASPDECRLLRARLPEVWDSLAPTFTVPSAADTAAPCPDQD